MGLHPLETVSLGVGQAAKTLVRHYARSKEEQQEVPARKELLFDEAFHVSKAFLDRAMSHSVESIQMLCHARVPAPPWVSVNRVGIPTSMCDTAAQIIIQCFGEEEIERVVGGREWWQQRIAKDEGGVEGEWIWIKSQEQARRKEQDTKKQKKQKKEDSHHAHQAHHAEEDPQFSQDEYTSQLDDQKCLFYIHGGGYYFGSIDIYRYTIWRYARKIDGRAFALRYRLSPQYPFPCALQDALSAYLYLIRPPPEAKHRPVDPSRMVIAGDSAGGGLSLALLCLLRDMRLPLPSGGVLISPWLDLTHSFPSILQNTATDIIPDYGFMHKPSVLWPPPDREAQSLIQGYTSVEAIKEREASQSTSRKSSGLGRMGSLLVSPITGSKKSGASSPTSPAQKSSPHTVLSEPHGARHAFTEEPEDLENPQGYHAKDADHKGEKPAGQEGNSAKKESQNRTEPDELISMEVDGKKVELREQIQMYALNSQLTYPYVSPILQPSLGGLPDLLIIAGDKEVLRDEAIYCAHRAAHPERYPLRKPLRDFNPERTALGDSYKPTRVHLQVYDDMPHDLVLFSMASSTKYAYRSIASFCKAVMAPESERLPNSLDAITSLNPKSVGHEDLLKNPEAALYKHGRLMAPPPHKKLTPVEAEQLQQTIYSPLHPFHRPSFEDGMIRERVGIDGVVRPLEPSKELQACCMHSDDVGLIKEGPVKRYLQGKAKWDKKYTEKRIYNKRKKNVKKAAKEEAKRLTRKARGKEKSRIGDGEMTDSEEEEALGTWAHIDGERPPPSSIAARRDTTDALQMAYSLKRHKESSRLNPISLWSNVHDLAAAFPNRTNGPDNDDHDTTSEASSRVSADSDRDA